MQQTHVESEVGSGAGGGGKGRSRLVGRDSEQAGEELREEGRARERSWSERGEWAGD